MDYLKQHDCEDIYVIDASAILNSTEIEDYENLISPSIFILTTICLKELDDFKRRDQSKYYSFMKFLNDVLSQGRLSDGIKLSKGNYLYFVKAHLDNIIKSFPFWIEIMAIENY